MVCEKCNRQIAEDSVYCSYCGVTVNVQSNEKTEDVACVRPHMPKKHCASCGKELPGSTISELCAMCTIRRRNRELEERRKNDDQSYAARDRYDISDEFDQTVFDQNRSSYYKGESDDRFEQARTAQKSQFSGHSTKGDSPDIKKTNGIKIALIALLCFLFLPLFLTIAFGSCGAFMYGNTGISEVQLVNVGERRRDLPSVEALLAMSEADFNSCFSGMSDEELQAFLDGLSAEDRALFLDNVSFSE